MAFELETRIVIIAAAAAAAAVAAMDDHVTGWLQMLN